MSEYLRCRAWTVVDPACNPEAFWTRSCEVWFNVCQRALIANVLFSTIPFTPTTGEKEYKIATMQGVNDIATMQGIDDIWENLEQCGLSRMTVPITKTSGVGYSDVNTWWSVCVLHIPIPLKGKASLNEGAVDDLMYVLTQKRSTVLE